jgi:hypothetical protein
MNAGGKSRELIAHFKGFKWQKRMAKYNIFFLDKEWEIP